MNTKPSTDTLIPSPRYSGERARVRGNPSKAEPLAHSRHRLTATKRSAAIILLTALCLIVESARAQSTMPTTQAATQPTTEPSSTAGAPIPLWTTAAPNSFGDADADIPKLLPYLPAPDRATDSAIIICQGGAYNHYGLREGEPVARWLNSLGISAFILKYRLGPKYHYPVQLQDVQRALRLIRFRASDFHLNPNHIGIIGFSAGGHLAALVSTHFDPGDPAAWDPIDRQSSRPDLTILVYPVITMLDAYTHNISRQELLGDNPDPDLEQETSNELHVTSDTPPCFLVHATDDHTAPVENSLMFAQALQSAGVPFELHIFDHGKHAFALGGDDPELSTWPKLAAQWLKTRSFLTN